MDRIRKALQKFTARERKGVREILIQQQSENYANLDIKKLKGRDDIFRVRKGDIRIIYRTVGNKIFALVIERRRESASASSPA